MFQHRNHSLVHRFACALICLLVVVTSSMASAAPATIVTEVDVVFGPDVPTKIQERIPVLLGLVPNLKLRIWTKEVPAQFPARSIVLAFGENQVTRKFIQVGEASGPEAFIVRSRVEGTTTFIVADGNASARERTSITLNRGLAFGIYETLQRLGFRFSNPFTPVAPQALATKTFADVAEKPHWPKRGLHLHTMHPIELTHVLNGWGEGGPGDAASFEKLTAEWELFCEWMIAHRQNQVQWVLLADKLFADFNDSTLRMQRLQKVVRISHAWGLLTGIDVGVVFEQQNMWRLLRNPSTPQSDAQEIKTRLRWLMQADFDSLNFEMGQTEFTAPDEDKMLLWMNLITGEMEDVYNRPALVKVHVSGGQTAKRYKDPQTGQPLNFNFLPYYADKRLVVLPHTVQIYGLKDPAPTYGNKDFSEIERFISMTIKQRPVMFYPEAAYWVSYDIDVPLFLPVYAERRLSDLRILAKKENQLGQAHLQGQMLFSSGFEWGYWLANVVAMRAAWNPHLEATSDLGAFRTILNEIFNPSLTGSNEIVQSLLETVQAQHDILIRGKMGNQIPNSIERRSGIAYLAGTETWDEINTSLNDILGMTHAATQPHRMGFRSLRRGFFGQAETYKNQIRPLLKVMSTRFMELANQMVRLSNRPDIDASLRRDLTEFAHGSQINAMRALQSYMLYESVAGENLGESKAWSQLRLTEAKKALDRASSIVADRQKNFSVNVERIAGWNTNPTAYRYGYLWTAQTLFFWFRDEGLVTKLPPNECFMNIVNPADIAFADGQRSIYYTAITTLSKLPFVGSYEECLSPSSQEPNPKARVR